MSVKTIEYKTDKYGFLKQQNTQPFDYSLDYKAKQATNSKMAWLRLGWLSALIPYEELRDFNVVDIGAGNNCFVREAEKVFKRIVPYDLTGESIADTELYSTVWDLLVMSDVLEHYQDIDDLWELQFKYALISYPETPDIDLERWRHYKPNEHIYCLNRPDFYRWVMGHGYYVVASGSPEDILRHRWDPDFVNITTVLIKRWER
jgi:hypothetical protein